jgi:hypothetical protein
VLFIANAFALHGLYLWLFVAQSSWYALALVGGFLSTRIPAPVVVAVEERRP